jgi:Mn2+/Fe2+ NRAMP family transporter
MRQLEPMRADTNFGMAVSNVIAYFIMLDTGALLHAHVVTHIETAIQAAEALRPVGGELAFLLFAVGIIGTGLLAVPVLASSVGDALAEIAHWSHGLAKKLASARAFYGTIAAVTLLGLALNLTGISPLKALFWSAVINGLCAGPIIVLVMLMTSNGTITGGWSSRSRNGSSAGSRPASCWRSPAAAGRVRDSRKRSAAGLEST